MSCKRCPHHVRHGQMASDGKAIEFHNLCGLKHKQGLDLEIPVKKGRMPRKVAPKEPEASSASKECVHYPFHDDFDYLYCDVYQNNFATKGMRNNVVPTKDFQYSEKLVGTSVTDMELL